MIIIHDDGLIYLEFFFISLFSRTILIRFQETCNTFVCKSIYKVLINLLIQFLKGPYDILENDKYTLLITFTCFLLFS